MLTNSVKTKIVNYFNDLLRDFYKETDKSIRRSIDEKIGIIDDILHIFRYEIIGCDESGTQIIRIFPKTYSDISIEKELKYIYCDIINGFYSSVNRNDYKSKLDVFNKVLEILGYEIQGYGEDCIIFNVN